MQKQQVLGTIKRSLLLHNWPQYSWALVKLLVRFLLKVFDENRLLYFLAVFPIYQLFSFVGIAFSIMLVSSLSSQASWWKIMLAIPTLLFFAIPVFSTWHLSCLLFFKGYFDFIHLVTGLRFIKFTSDFINSFIQMFRNGISYADIK